MYHPIIKNKLNELKGLKGVNCSLSYSPIIELTDTRTDDISTFFSSLTDEKSISILDITREKECFIDLPSYLNNEVINTFNLRDGEEKYNFFLTLESSLKEKSSKKFIPVISFDHSHPTPRKSQKENVNFAKKIIEHFDFFAIRLFSDYSFKNEDYNLLWQLYDFMGDTIAERATLIFDIDSFTMEHSHNIIKEIVKEFKILKIILAGEVLNGHAKSKTEFSYKRLSNPHLDRVKYFVDTLDSYALKIDYADFTLTDKIPSSLDIDPEKGFSYYPFIKFTTEDAKICMFTADEKGNYQQYQELCKRVANEIRGFSVEHCSTCSFINQVATTEDPDSIAYKGSNVWKHRMISHHITALAMCV